jgi:hypothetical protein
MSLSWSATLAAGIFASIGACGLFAFAFFKDDGRRRSAFRLATLGFTIGGLVMMLAAVAGVLGAQELFGGLLLVLFGTGSSVLSAKALSPAPPEEPTH